MQLIKAEKCCCRPLALNSGCAPALCLQPPSAAPSAHKAASEAGQSMSDEEADPPDEVGARLRCKARTGAIYG
jgi:hypothetical protein